VGREEGGAERAQRADCALRRQPVCRALATTFSNCMVGRTGMRDPLWTQDDPISMLVGAKMGQFKRGACLSNPNCLESLAAKPFVDPAFSRGGPVAGHALPCHSKHGRIAGGGKQVQTETNTMSHVGGTQQQRKKPDGNHSPLSHVVPYTWSPTQLPGSAKRADGHRASHLYSM